MFQNSVVTPAEFEKIVAEYAVKLSAEVEQEFRAFCASQIKRAQIQVNCEDRWRLFAQLSSGN